jgi:Mycobacterium membrane protein
MVSDGADLSKSWPTMDLVPEHADRFSTNKDDYPAVRLQDSSSARLIKGPQFLRNVPAAILLCVLLGAFAGCGSGSGSSSPTDVAYGVTGSACSADITYQDLTETQTTLVAQSLPWNFQFSVPATEEHGFPLFLLAVNDCLTGSITVNAVVNGSLYSTATQTFPPVPNAGIEISVNLF